MTSNRIEGLVVAYNDIQDRLYEIDKSWKNNLIFYGIPTDGRTDEVQLRSFYDFNTIFHLNQ